MNATLIFSLQLVRLGVRSLLVHKLRSVLAVMGVVFGVGSVVSMLAIGEGASHEVQAQLRRLGPDRLLLKSVRPPDARVARGLALEYGLTEADLRRIRNLVPGLVAVAPTYEVGKEKVWVGHRSAEPTMVATTAASTVTHLSSLTRVFPLAQILCPALPDAGNLR